MKNKLPIIALAVLAVVLIALHLRMPHSMQTWRIRTPAAAARSGETMNASMPQGNVNVNTAPVEALEALTGVGPMLAQEIIAERELNGDFHYAEDLINVKGIGESKLEQMREQLLLP